jgi:hypothetical protein
MLDNIKADVINIADCKQSIKVRSVLRIIDKYKAGNEQVGNPDRLEGE